MRVSDRELTGHAASESGRSQDTQKVFGGGGAAPAPIGGSGDRVELSSGLASVSRALAAESSAHASKVQQLGEQYQAGTYEPDSLSISQGLVAEAMSNGAN